MGIKRIEKTGTEERAGVTSIGEKIRSEMVRTCGNKDRRIYIVTRTCKLVDTER